MPTAFTDRPSMPDRRPVRTSRARTAAISILISFAAGLASCGGSEGIVEAIEIDVAAWSTEAPHLKLTVTPKAHQGADRYAATFFSAKVVLPEDESVEVARYRSYREADDSIMRGWLGGAGEQRVALKLVGLDETALDRARQLGGVVVHVDELRGEEVVVADALVARLSVDDATARPPGEQSDSSLVSELGVGVEAASDPTDTIKSLQSSVSLARRVLEQRQAGLARARKSIIEQARVEALSESWALEGYLSNLEQVVDEQGRDGSLTVLGWVVEKTKKVPALWEFTDDVKAFHALCVDRLDAKRALADADRRLHEYRSKHDAAYAEELHEQARQREELALAAAQAKTVEAAARAEAAREETARAEAATAEALRAEAAREHSSWLESVHECDSLPNLSQLAAKADMLRDKHRAHWADAAARSHAAEALAGSLARIAPGEHDVLAEDGLPREFTGREGVPESEAWLVGAPLVPETTITAARSIVGMIASLDDETTTRAGLLDDRFWTAIQETQRGLAEDAAARDAALAEARARYHEQLVGEIGSLATVSAVNNLTHRVRDGQSLEPNYWDDADVSQYAKMQAQALREMVGGHLSPGPLFQPVQTLVKNWSYRNDRHVADRWRDACQAFPEGEAESFLALLTDGCLMSDARPTFAALPTLAKDPAFWVEVVNARTSDD